MVLGSGKTLCYAILPELVDCYNGTSGSIVVVNTRTALLTRYLQWKVRLYWRYRVKRAVRVFTSRAGPTTAFGRVPNAVVGPARLRVYY